MTAITASEPAKPTYDPTKARSAIAYWTHVWVRDIDVERVLLTCGQDVVDSAEVTLTAATVRDGRRLAAILDLPQEAADPSATWRNWSGWVSEISAQRPVLVRVTAPTSAAQETS